MPNSLGTLYINIDHLIFILQFISYWHIYHIILTFLNIKLKIKIDMTSAAPLAHTKNGVIEETRIKQSMEKMD